MKETENILNEMGELGNILKDASKDMPNAVPQQYFDLLAENIMHRIHVEEEIKSLTPLLGGINKEMPHTVPNEYFENLLINKPATLKSKIIKFGVWKKLMSAAVVTGIIVGSFYIFKDEQKTDFTAEVQKISTEDLAKNIDSFTTALPSNTDNEEVEDIPDTKDALQLASDDDLQQFINENNDTQIDNEETKI